MSNSRDTLRLRFNEVLHRMYNLEILPHIQSLIKERIPHDPTLQLFEIPSDLWQAIDQYTEAVCKVPGETSDGYHTFNELYEFRKLYNALLFNEWALHADCPKVVRSRLHSDGTEPFGGGWFIVVAELPTGQISNHYDLKDWDLFHNVPEVERAPEYDGHTPQDVLQRLASLTGTIYVCGAWGKTARRLLDFKDASCAVNAVLCKEDSLKYEDGRVIEAKAVEDGNE